MLNGLFLGHSIHQMVEDHKKEIHAQLASHSAAEARLQSRAMQADIEKLFMITQALWELLKTEHGYTDEMLANKVTDIDLSDGRLDGKVAKKGRPDCPSCGRRLGRHPVCIYCGAQTVADPFSR